MDQMQWTNNVASKLDASSDIGIFQHHQTHLGVSLTNVIGGAVKKTSFPKRVTFDVFADSTKAPIQSVCPNCTMYGEMKAYDVFDEEYVPIKQYCDATDVCSNVQFELKCMTSYSSASCPVEAQKTTGLFAYGSGNISFVSRPGKLGAVVTFQ
ncbi:hypothetical protein RFI_31225 [Reticulomyxa filosa]|uniref:Uncharacterized protein n=1 Tax=Reticulomyxa filosa TaxID=46433 RepID=X6LZK6_RETFI|nr:hypothetical protein RFI_31225 [Reticulomyxa filosa]|eukprot:ETO06170.1 hypothetical protein RFI_31225 [Reticulomyxa filosa]